MGKNNEDLLTGQEFLNKNSEEITLMQAQLEYLRPYTELEELKARIQKAKFEQEYFTLKELELLLAKKEAQQNGNKE